jgi:hypothetical protein
MRHDLPALKLLGALSLAAGCSATIPFDDVSKGSGGGPDKNFSCDDHPDADFCDDFDSEPLADRWGADALLVAPEGQGEIETSSSDAVSEPNALVATMNGMVSEGAYAACIASHRYQLYEDKAFHAHVSFAIKVEDFDSSQGVMISAFQFLLGSEVETEPFNQLVFNIRSNGTSVSGLFTENIGGPSTDTHSGDPQSGPAISKWTQVEFDLWVSDPSGGGGNKATLKVGEKLLWDNKLKLDLFGGVPRMELGVPAIDTDSDDWRIRYDNVLVEIEEIED